MSAPFVVAIVGPTGSGKSLLAEEVALTLGGEVVSVDAMQVYRGLNIGTAKLAPAQRRVALHMVDVCDPSDEYSVQLFQQDGRTCIDALLKEEKTPVLCGGTGLYLNALIDEMSFPKGERASASRESYEAYLAEHGVQALYQLLYERDSKSANLIHPNNSRRVVRALELLDEGVSYAEHHEGLHKRTSHYRASLWGLTLNRDELYERLNKRVDAMFEQGLVDEVLNLRAQGFSSHCVAGQAIGYKELLAYFEGACTLEEAKEAIKANTRRYAKRQLSWFRNDERVQWLDMGELSLKDACDCIVKGVAHA